MTLMYYKTICGWTSRVLCQLVSATGSGHVAADRIHVYNNIISTAVWRRRQQLSSLNPTVHRRDADRRST